MLRRPTVQGRAGFNPTGFGAGISAPYGFSTAYTGHHNGEDYFWLGKESSGRLGISTEQSKRIYPVTDGQVNHTSDTALGLGLWQQIDADHRAYYWHLRDREPAGHFTTEQTIGRMGATGTGSSGQEHLHFEIRRAPYGKADRVNPAPFFTTINPAGNSTTMTESEADMPMFLGNNTITWPNGYSNAYRADIYEAMRLVVEDGNRDATRVATLVRESWEAANFITARNAEATTRSVVAALGKSTVDVDAIVSRVVAAMPTPQTIADATVDEFKSRL